MKPILATFVAFAIGSAALFCGCSKKTGLLPEQQEWERLAEAGDTASMHRLINFYDSNHQEILDVVAVYSDDGEDITTEVQSEIERENTELNRLYGERLRYWLDKGEAMGDPLALHIKGMRLYYTDWKAAIPYLERSARMGNAEAALFCGTAYYNIDRGDKAIEYLIMADEMGVPSAGWHLAFCYVGGGGATPDLDKAVRYLEKAGRNNYPEALVELRRIDPGNPLWQHKIDSLGITMAEFPIIPDRKRPATPEADPGQDGPCGQADGSL